MTATATVGVLALQGDFQEHCTALRGLGASVVEVRRTDQLHAIDALIIPGGESTSMAKLMDAYEMRAPLQAFASSGRPVWGTCAGLILLASRLAEDRPEPLGTHGHRPCGGTGSAGRWTRSRPSWTSPGCPADAVHAVFIRAPLILDTGPDVQTLASLEDGTAVVVRQGHLLASAFHPELTGDARMHRYFLGMLPVGAAP